MLATLAITIQGVQFLAMFAGSFTAGHEFPVALPTIFLPAAGLSILRLQAAYWVSDDYGYLSYQPATSSTTLSSEAESQSNKSTPNIGIISFSNDIRPAISMAESRVRSHKSMGAIYIRIWWLLSLLLFLVAAIFGIMVNMAWYGVFIQTATMFCRNLFYLLICLAGVFTHVWYVVKGDCGSTVIPCIQARWYKGLTVILLLLGVASVVLSCFETRKLANGEYTTYPPP
jgi:hypothetical protein